jgi:exopolysaccharide biosynthesis polyprenyl glycosylphosphotransferase
MDQPHHDSACSAEPRRQPAQRMTETATADVRTLGELRGIAMRRHRRMEPVAVLTGASTAALVVALGAPARPLNALLLTFGVFMVVGLTLGRRSRWSPMLPFTRVLVDVLYPTAAAAVVWTVMARTDAAQFSLTALVVGTGLAAYAATLARRSAPPARSRIVVVGNPRSADHLRRELRRSESAYHEVVGVVIAGPGSELLAPGEVPLLGGLAMLDEIIERHDVDMLLLDGGASRIEVFDQLAETCLELPVYVCELTQFYEDTFGHVPVTEIDSAWFRYIMHPRFRSPETVAKRTMDLVVALTAGVAFLPVIGVCALLIKLHDGGPVLFRQRRIGGRGREFTLIKLRTMRAEPAEGRWSSADDERVTPIGRRLRRMHLDEVPQLLNVLRGEMSVVGPRPEQPDFVERLEGSLPHYSRRHLIKPGLTGWAQVRCGYAGSVSGSAWKLCHDLYYLKHQSFGLDLAILLETVRTLIADRQFPASHHEVVASVPAPAGNVRALFGRSRARQLPELHSQPVPVGMTASVVPHPDPATDLTWGERTA